MVSSPRRQKSKNRFSGNHQRGWLWGHHAVLETLVSGRWPVLEIYVSEQAFNESASLLTQKRDSGILVHTVEAARLEELSHSSEHQGLVVRLGPFPYESIGDLESRLNAWKDSTPRPLIVICDRIQDAFNFGAILRCCDGVSAMAVIVGEMGQAEVTPHVARASSGAVNHVPIVRVSNLLDTAKRLKSLGLQIVAADANKATNLWDAKLEKPTAVIIGSEADGIDLALLEICDQRIFIPMNGKVTSLNVAVASGIFLYEARRQQTHSAAG